jgi:riboflavin-specific deaminase-like protein
VNRPRVIANFALTADGKVSTRNLTPAAFTSPKDKHHLLEIRALGDALLAGARTVKADHMSMRLTDKKLQQERLARGQTPEPLPVITSNSGALDPAWKVFQKPAAPLVIFSTRRMPDKNRAFLSRQADVWLFEDRSVPLAAMLAILRRDCGVRTLVCEGGPTLFRALLEIGAIDELHLTWAPVIFGGAKAPTLTGLPGAFLPKTVQARLKKMEVVEGECFLTYKVSSSPLTASKPSP